MASTQTRTGTGTGTTDGARPAVFRATPLVTLVAVAFFALCLSPIAFQGHWWLLLFLVPVAMAVVVVRTRTRVDTDGLHVRTALGSRDVPWSGLETLRVAERGWVRAVAPDGRETALPGVRTRDVGRLGDASGGHVDVPGPAEAEAAAERQRELEATRLKVERARELARAQAESDTADAEAGADAAADAETTDEGAGPEARADGTRPDDAPS